MMFKGLIQYLMNIYEACVANNFWNKFYIYHFLFKIRTTHLGFAVLIDKDFKFHSGIR